MELHGKKPLPASSVITEDTAIRRALKQRYGFIKISIKCNIITGHYMGEYGSWTMNCGHRWDYTTANYNGHSIRVLNRGHLVGVVYGRISTDS